MLLGLFDQSCDGPMGNWDAVTGKRCARTAALLVMAVYVVLVVRLSKQPFLLFVAPLLYIGVYQNRVAAYRRARRVTFAE